MGVKIPQDSMVYLLVCISGLVIFIFLGLVPSHRNLAGLESKIGEVNLRIEEQKTLAPIYQTLKQKTRKSVPGALPFPAKTEPAQVQAEQIMEGIKDVAVKANLGALSITPNLSYLSGNPRSLDLELTASGDFFSFRKFLTALGGVNFVEHIEEIQIQQSPDALQLKIKHWIARSRQVS